MHKPAARKSKTIRKLSDLTPDKFNANAHTERGVGMLEHSLRTMGAGRSIVVDRDGHVIAGNSTLKQAVALGLGVQVVRTRGDELVVVQREDLDLNEPRARELAISDNRTAEVGLNWDAANLTALQADGLDLKPWFFENEISQVLGLPPDNPADHWRGMPECEQEDQTAWKSLRVNFASKADYEAFSRAVNQTLTDKTRSIWFPPALIGHYAGKAYTDEP